MTTTLITQKYILKRLDIRWNIFEFNYRMMKSDGQKL